MRERGLPWAGTGAGVAIRLVEPTAQVDERGGDASGWRDGAPGVAQGGFPQSGSCLLWAPGADDATSASWAGVSRYEVFADCRMAVFRFREVASSRSIPWGREKEIEPFPCETTGSGGGVG
jgi:hypothetical protein